MSPGELTPENRRDSIIEIHPLALRSNYLLTHFMHESFLLLFSYKEESHVKQIFSWIAFF